MKKITALIMTLLICLLSFAGCLREPEGQLGQNTPPVGDLSNTQGNNNISGDPDETFGEDLGNIGINDGYFEEETVDIEVKCISGTSGAYSLNGNVLTFSAVSEDSVYSISGQLNGSMVIDTGDDFKFELELTGLSLVSKSTNPISILSGDKVTLTAKKETENYIYDKREAVDEADETLKKGAIYSEVDLQIGGKGALTVVSDNNNGIHTKDDLEVKNLTLTVTCKDNALKGNDSVEMTDGRVILIASQGDGIKTANSDISSKGNRRGTISITGTSLTVYAACDGIDAAYDAVIDGEATSVSIYTDKYSTYSEEVTATSSSEYYIRFTSKSYKYSVKYYNSETDYEWVNATYHSTVSGGRTSYYYYSFPKKTSYSKMQFFVYSSDMADSQETDYLVASEGLTPNDTYDTFALSSRGSSLTYSWINYTTSVQDGMGGRPGGMGGGPGGMGGDGNSDKGDHSTKGIKAANEIVINNGSVSIKSYDDSLHADNATAIENGASPLGNVTVNGGLVSLYSNDDGIHAEGRVYIKGGSISVLNSYEGVEGSGIVVSGGELSVIAKDDGMNATATSGTGITLSGGFVYVYCTGDGLDTNSRASYSGISFEGGDAIIIANSGGNSAIDTEQGYKYTAGSIVAIMPRGGMTGESTHCQSFSSVGTSKTMSFSSGGTLTVSGAMQKTITMPCSISNAFVVILNKNISVSN